MRSAPLSTPSARKIRFAPLPNPRALEDGAATVEDGDGYETLVDPQFGGSDAGCSSLSSSSLLSSPFIGTKDLLTPADSSISRDPSLNGSQATLADPYGPEDMTPTGSNSGTPSDHKKASSWTSKPKRLFKPFLRRSSSPMAPPSSFGSGITKEDILTLGTINLFRSASRESRVSTTESLPPTPLNRWTSAGSYTGQKNKDKQWLPSPLSRTDSTGSIKFDSRGRPIRTPPAKSSTTPQANGKRRLRGTRMLNGRVYGGRGLNAQGNLFETAKDTEPEFVEWGYGGMGSVKAGQHGDKQWSKLQSTGTSVGGGGGDDDDDGGGMAWARRRREAMERAKKEAEEKAKAEAEAEAKETEKSEGTEGAEPSVVQEEPAPEEESPSPATELLSSPIAESTPVQPEETSNQKEKEEEQHVTTAVNVPVRQHGHHHHRSTSASVSAVNSSTNLAAGEMNRDRPTSNARMASFEQPSSTVGIPVHEKYEDTIRSISSSSSDSEDDNGEDDDDDEAEDEDEEAEVKQFLFLSILICQINSTYFCSISAKRL